MIEAFWAKIVGLFFTFMILLIMANGIYFMITGRFTLFGLDRLLIGLIEGIFNLLSQLLGEAARGLGSLIADGLREFFARIFNRQEEEEEEEVQPQRVDVHVYHHHDPPPLADPEDEDD